MEKKDFIEDEDLRAMYVAAFMYRIFGGVSRLNGYNYGIVELDGVDASVGVEGDEIVIKNVHVDGEIKDVWRYQTKSRLLRVLAIFEDEDEKLNFDLRVPIDEFEKIVEGYGNVDKIVEDIKRQIA